LILYKIDTEHILKDIVEEWKRKGGECETVTINCPFCHHGMVAEVTPDLMKRKEQENSTSEEAKTSFRRKPYMGMYRKRDQCGNDLGGRY